MKRIILNNGSAPVDDEDWGWLNAYSWSALKTKRNTHYAVNTRPFNSYMHIVIYKRHNLYDPNFDIDHINNNGLDNQKNNLQLLTRRENALKAGMFSDNTSGFRGVWLVGEKWRATINSNGRKIHIGMYDTAVEAAIAWNRVAKAAFGPNTYQNIIPEEQHY